MNTTSTPQNTRYVTLYLESNPNPNSLKFVANFMLVPEGESFDYPNVESAENSPLAQMLFGFDFVDRVFIMSNFVTVTKKESVEWAEIQAELKQAIYKYMQENNFAVKPEAAPTNQQASENDTETVKKIKGILDEYIRPAVESDGGAIQFHSFNDGVVKVLLQGSCSGCPSSTITLKAGIENLLKRMLPEVKTVEAEGV
ncbi:NifU family protein [Nafulsella turpanensis]|uniref:NifU family protein n=1 Tax=Nafulsella turpanensis TaxID=1265690 RepID=UPI0003701348|nr:NifU family protein [Nafulsella turpanensis]